MSSNKHKVILIDVCKNCGRTLKEEWKFCPDCRSRVETRDCPFCREEIKTQWEFCPNCKRRVKDVFLTGQNFKESNEWLRNLLKKD